MFSQRNEEGYIVRFFKDVQGKFLDIGAYDGQTFSNTRQLALQGWGGVCVEASPSLYEALRELYRDNPKIQILEVGISETGGVLPFYDFLGDAVGTFDKKHAEVWSNKAKDNYKIIPVRTISVQKLLDDVGYDFDFLNLDIEGWSVRILKQIPFDKLTNLKMVCVEFDHQEAEVLQFLNKLGFCLLHKTAENLIVVK